MYMIDRGELLMQMMHKFHYELPDGCNNPLYGDVIKVIEDAPTIEAEPIRHGRWVNKEVDEIRCHVYGNCSVCHERKRIDNYCPNCGAKMDKES